MLAIAFLNFAIAITSALQLNVGAILEGSSPGKEAAFRKAIYSANERLSRSQRSSAESVSLNLILKNIEVADTFAAASATCQLLSEGVVAIFGPDSPTTSTQAQWICQNHQVPYLLAHWDPIELLDEVADAYGDNKASHLLNFTINLHPSHDEVGEALADFLHIAEEWQQLGFIYARDDSLVRYEKLLSKFRGRLMVRRLNTAALTHKYIIKYFMTTRSQNRFVVDIPKAEIEEFLKLISEYNMTDQYYSYIFTDWDAQFTDPRAFSVDKGANFTALSLLPLLRVNYRTTEEEVGKEEEGRDGIDEWNSSNSLQENEEHHSSPQNSLTYYFLILDTMNLLAHGISRLVNSMTIQPPVGLTCDSHDVWPQGARLLTEIKSVKGDEFRGQTGRVEFDSNGRRRNANITILEMNQDGILEYGYWNHKDKLVVTKEFSTTQAEIYKELKDQVLRVATIEEIPFVMYKGPAGEEKSSNPKDWHGFCIDLLDECAAALEFNYTVHPVTDGNYGTAKIINGQEVWDGIIGQLQFRKADLAVAMLTISYERERVIDFTTPFMNLGISIIFKKPEEKQPGLFSFLRPLSPTVWGYVLIAYVGVSIGLFFVARFSPYEWTNPHPCNVDSQLLKNNFNMLNSLWFTIGSLMQQGSDILPRATSTRIIAGFWWLFTLIIISSYTANLAAFLTVERMQAPIEDVNDLAKQTKIKYGTRSGGSSAAFFAKSNQSVYQRMWQYMSSQKGVMINNATEAIARVKRGGYAYILESTMNEYFTQRNCDLTQIGDNLDSKGYGIGFPQGSKYRDAFTEVILQLQASQHLEQIRHYWWRYYNITTPCSEKVTKSKDTSTLGLEQVGGCFVMILIGLGASVLISLQEFLYKVYHRVTITKRPFIEEAAREFRFSMARSSTRDFGAESALRLPPPPLPSQCLLPTKECRMAALAYAPCLPAVVRSSPPPSAAGTTGNVQAGMKRSRSSDSRRPSALEVARMHRRASCRRPSSRHVLKASPQPSHVSLSATSSEDPIKSANANPAFISDSTRILHPVNGCSAPVEINVHHPIAVSGLLDNFRRYPPPPPPMPQIGFIVSANGDTYPPPLGGPAGRSYGDIRVKKFTC
ncbi:Glutamate receptor ionotropic kainate 2 [Echinococcus multilocularis]|uniref:Glutamate receptor ionotropic kainate 2 n=1 Tax=Echinococcus multilocularis TaxID=6211 RepID=A0A068Y3K1_ECHMU|nr:Glutamate receptor ionotropic kainate 2 [Echinococcus multilocularis]